MKTAETKSLEKELFDLERQFETRKAALEQAITVSKINSLTDIVRYDLGSSGEFEDEDGDWVLYDDVAILIEKLEAQIALAKGETVETSAADREAGKQHSFYRK